MARACERDRSVRAGDPGRPGDHLIGNGRCLKRRGDLVDDHALGLTPGDGALGAFLVRLQGLEDGPQATATPFILMPDG
jgi:hypothetical protein